MPGRGNGRPVGLGTLVDGHNGNRSISRLQENDLMSDLPEIAFNDLEGLRSVITEEWSDWGP